MRTLLLPLFLLFAIVNTQAEGTLVAGFHCPDDVWLDCDDELWDLGIYGNAYYVDYGGNHHYAGSPTVNYYLNGCNVGKIVRTWNYEDPYWNWHTCSQTIHVGGGNGGAYNIHWPQDIELEGCHATVDPYDLPYGHGNPTWSSYDCSNIGVNYDDDVFYFGGDCKKIKRTWTLIDWCTYDPNGYGNAGIWTWVQIIKVTNDIAPDLYCPIGVKVPSYDCHDATVLLSPVAADHSVCGGQFQITNNSIYAWENGADASGVYPIGVHHVTYTIHYGCGTYTTCSVQIIVENSKNPVPYCYGELVVVLMPVDANSDGVAEDGMVQIWASDLNLDSFHPCGYGPLTYSFSPDKNDTHKTFTCEDVGKNDVRMYVHDPYGGYSYCIVEVDVQNNLANIQDCHPSDSGGGGYTNASGRLLGSVMMSDDSPLPNTTMTIESADPQLEITETLTDVEYVETVVDSYNTPLGNTVFLVGQDTIRHYSYDTTSYVFTQSVMTNSAGQYELSDVVTEEMMHLMPKKLTCDMSKVTIDDAKVLHAFITGSSSFDNPYLYLAADVDDNMKVNFDDLNAMIKYLVGTTPALPCVEPYWFIPEDASAANPFDMAIINPVEVMVHETTPASYDMMAIMKGDLDMLIEPGLLQEILDNSTLQISPTTDVDDLFADNDVEVLVAPNPTSDIVNISLEGKGLNGKYRLQIFGTDGKLMMEDRSQNSNSKLNFSMDVCDLHPGLYFYKVSGQENEFKGSFIKN